jgi:fatty-acyl-CoA synthase
MIVYTSGTTGAPKGARLSHRGVVNNAWLLSQRLELPAGSVWLNPMPMFHVSGNIWFAGGALASGGCHVLMRGYDAGLVCRLLAEERAALVLAVPTMLIDLLQTLESADPDLSALRVVASGGSPIAAELARRVEERTGARFTAGYGQTETSQVITQAHASDTIEDKVGTNGQPLPHTEVKVVDPATGEVVDSGAVGEIMVRSYGVMQGYFEMEEATRAAIEPDGWLHTGDLGTMDPRGYVRITGRLKEMIIRGGENISPREIEDVLFTHPAVVEAAVVGVPDARLGEEIAAFVRRRADAEVSAEELRLYVRERLAPFKTPRHWRFVDHLPVTASGKVQKFRLREQFAEITTGP